MAQGDDLSEEGIREVLYLRWYRGWGGGGGGGGEGGRGGVISTGAMDSLLL